MEDSKPFVPHSHIPYGKLGSGTFSDRNISIHEVSHAAVPLVLETVHSMVIDSRSVFTIVDYGTADGGTSMPVIYACVKLIREKYGNELPIIVIYEDQPVNNFTSVFLRIQGLIPGPRSFLQDFPNVFVMASGTNFYSQCFPNNTVALGLSSISVHWLSKKPCNITGAIHHLMASVPEEEEQFRKQAEEDWEIFLMKRAAELMPGARMVLSQSVVDEHGQYPGNTNNIKVNCSALLNNLWKALLGDGVITQDEFTNTNFNFYLRTIDEFKKPFECNDSPVVKAGLELGSIETKILHCPYKEKWFKEKHKVKEHAINYVEGIRTWSNSSFLSGLSESRSDEEKIKIVDELFHRLEDEVVNHPEDHGIEFVCCYFVIKKRQL